MNIFFMDHSFSITSSSSLCFSGMLLSVSSRFFKNVLIFLVFGPKETIEYLELGLKMLLIKNRSLYFIIVIISPDSIVHSLWM